MSQVEVTKVHGWVAYGPEPDVLTVTKVHGWVLLVPGDDTGDTAVRQGFCYGQRITRRG